MTTAARNAQNRKVSTVSRDLVRSPGRPAATIARAPFARRAWCELGYALIGLPLGVAGFVLTVVPLSVGLGILSLVIGLPLLTVGSIVARWFGAVDRAVARRLLGMNVAEPAPLRIRPGVLGWFRSQLTDVVAWRARAYLLLRLPVSIATFVVAVIFFLMVLGHPRSPLFLHDALPI